MLNNFLATRGHDADVQSDLALLRQEYALEVEPAPEWGGDDPVRAVPYVHFFDWVRSQIYCSKISARKNLAYRLPVWPAKVSAFCGCFACL